MRPEYVPLLVGAGMLVVAAVLLAVVVRHHWRRMRELAAGGPGGGPEAAAQGGAGGESAEALDRLARRIESRVDTKMAELQRLLAGADERIAQLRRLTPPPAGPAESGGSRQADLTGRQEEILRLHAQGMDAVRIARRMEMDVGEVHLVLNLHRQQTLRSPPQP